MSPPVKPEQFDYLAAVDAADESGYNWGALFQATQDPGFKDLKPEEQKHIGYMLQVKIAKEQGIRADPFARTGEVGGLRRAGQAILSATVGALPIAGRSMRQTVSSSRQDAVADYINQGVSKEQAEQFADRDLKNATGKIIRQFSHYLTGGLVDAPMESKDPFAQQIMDERVKPITGLAAVGTQIAGGWGLLGVVSKVPLISARAANLSAVTRGLIKGGILDFGINAAHPDGLPKEERLGISDDIARALAPESVLADPTSLSGRVVAGVGGLVEGAILGGVLYGIGHGVKLADAKHAWTMTPAQQERIRKSLEAAGVDVSQMSKSDLWLTYRTRMSEQVQGIDEAVFNGERLSAEAWIAHAFLADPNVTELTAAEGRILWGIFNNNKGGVSLIRGIEDPAAALDKLKKVGIEVEAHVIPRATPGAPPVSAKNAPTKPPAGPPKAEHRARKLVGDEEFNKRLRQSLGNIKGPLGPGVLEAHADAIARQILRDRPGARIKAATERAVRAERRAVDAERLATTDPITGLQNATAWSKAHTRIDADETLEVVAIDLENFKQVNDLISHQAGDRMLKRVAGVLLASVKDVPGGTAQVFRKGGDEFVIVVPKGEGAAALKRAQDGLGYVKVTGQGKEAEIRIRGGIGATFDQADAAEAVARQQSKTRLGREPSGTIPKPPDDPPPPTPVKRTRGPRKPKDGGQSNIKSAAYKDEQGNVYEGINHGEAADRAAEGGANVENLIDGFVTKDGTFVTRDEAVKMGASPIATKQPQRFQENTPPVGGPSPEVTEAPIVMSGNLAMEDELAQLKTQQQTIMKSDSYDRLGRDAHYASLKPINDRIYEIEQTIFKQRYPRFAERAMKATPEQRIQMSRDLNANQSMPVEERLMKNRIIGEFDAKYYREVVEPKVGHLSSHIDKLTAYAERIGETGGNQAERVGYRLAMAEGQRLVNIQMRIEAGEVVDAAEQLPRFLVDDAGNLVPATMGRLPGGTS